MSTREPTKADLAAAVARLTEENAGLRDLLAAVSLAAGTVPVSQHNNYQVEWRRSCHVLSAIKVLSALDGGWESGAAYGAERLREVAAEPVGYEAYVQPAPCPSVAEHSGRPCTQTGEHVKHRNDLIVRGSGVTEPAPDWCPDRNGPAGAPSCVGVADHGGDEHWNVNGDTWPAGEGGVLAASIESGTPLVVDEDEASIAEAEAKAYGWCPAFTYMEHEEVTFYCDREVGHSGAHHAPGPDEGSEVAWSSEMTAVSA